MDTPRTAPRPGPRPGIAASAPAVLRSTTARTAAVRTAAVRTAALCTAAIAWLAPAVGAERALRGEARFEPPPAAALAALPAASPLSAADLRSGHLSFEIVYDDAARDADPDPYGGVYPGAIRAFRVRVGATTLELPAAGAELRVSDGGFGMAHRESVQMLAVARHGGWDLRVGWVRINQRASTEDLRGRPGSLHGDAIPEPGAMLAFATSGEFDHVVFMRLDPAGETRRPALYLSTSTLTVAPATPASR
jgi:hypothetical protein